MIACDFGGPKESIIDGRTGFLVENKNPAKLADKIDYLLVNRDEIKRMGRAARDHVEKNFMWVRHVNKLLDIYNLIVSKKEI